jgi:hypothetical protein
LVLGAFFASTAAIAAPANSGPYHLNIVISNTAVYEVFGPPAVDDDQSLPGGLAITIDPDSASIDVDGSGKISGFALASITTDQITDSEIALGVTGSIATKSGATIVQMRFSGKGFATDGTNYGPAGLTLKFTGQINGGFFGSSSSDGIAGIFDGSFSPGLPALKPFAIKHAAATITDFGLIPQLILDGGVVLAGNRVGFGGRLITPGGFTDLPMIGTGSLSSKNKLNLPLQATGWAHGSSLTVRASATDNPFTSDIGIGAITTLSVSGKILGQKLNTEQTSPAITPGI